jgi:hypothetical protein
MQGKIGVGRDRTSATRRLQECQRFSKEKVLLIDLIEFELPIKLVILIEYI